jgi:outer membrane protein assembly factor BamB
MLLPLSMLAATLALSGCTTVRGWFSSDDQKANAPSELSDFSPSVTVTKLWSADAGDADPNLGLAQMAAIADGRVYAAAVEGGVRAFDLQTGAVAWRYETEAEISGGPGAGEGLVVFGTLEGQVVALDAATGAEKWTAAVRNEIIAAPAIGQGVVLIRSNDGRVTAFDAANGQRRWFWNRELPNLSVRGNDSPTLGPGYVFVGNDDGTVVALALSDGRPLWEQAVGQPDGRSELDRMADVDGKPMLDDTVLYATSYKMQTMALEAPSGRPLWAQQQGGYGRIGVAADRVVVADRNGVVWALDKNGGSALWQQAGLTRRGVAGAAVQGEFAVVGDSEGYLHWLRLDNGDFAARVRVGRSSLRGAPQVADGVLIVQSADGEIGAYRLQ